MRTVRTAISRGRHASARSAIARMVACIDCFPWFTTSPIASRDMLQGMVRAIRQACIVKLLSRLACGSRG